VCDIHSDIKFYDNLSIWGQVAPCGPDRQKCRSK